MKAIIMSLISEMVLTTPLLAATSADDAIEARPGRAGVVQPDGQSESAQPLPVYEPPLRGAPASRVGGASRSLNSIGVALNVLAPDHTGLTVREQPTFYWHLSDLTAAPWNLRSSPRMPSSRSRRFRSPRQMRPAFSVEPIRVWHQPSTRC